MMENGKYEEFICVKDEGGANGAVQDMKYFLPQIHLIRLRTRLNNVEMDEFLAKIARTRKSPKIVGAWKSDEILKYENMGFGSGEREVK